jgi:hypothetical protein
MVTLTKRQKAMQEKRIEKIYYKSCSGIQINVMDIQKVFDEGHKAIAEGADDVQLEERIKTFVKSISQN